MQGERAPIEVFYSYAHEDELLRNELEKHLSILHRQGLISSWHDRKIVAGTDFAKDIDTHLETASLILLLVSSDFVSSDYCYGIEMKRALERHQANETKVIPILLRPVEWKGAPFEHLQALPTDAKPVTTWPNQDEAFANIALGIRQALGLKQTTSRMSRSTAPSPTFSSRTRQALWQMLSKEYSRQLSQTLPGATLLALGLHERTDLTRSPTQLVFRRTDEERPLPPDTSIIQVYDDAGQGLLILGEPGAGKTTLLLDLAQELLRRAETDESQPLPFIVNVSSWGKTKSALSVWLIEELSRAYDIPKALGRILLDSDQALLLLDGLDEVIRASRSACIEAINTYKGTHFGPLVVCCRSREYMEQQARLTVPTAVVVQPLSSEQVMSYLKHLGKALAAVRTVLQTNSILEELLTTPLMLNVVILAYRGKTVKDLPQLGGAEAQQQEIFRCYVERMIEQRGEPTPYLPQQMRRWLSWLARWMQQSSQSVHYIEHLQSDWLTSHRVQWYVWLGKYIPSILIGVLASVTLMTLLNGFSIPDRLSDGMLGGFCGGLLSSLTGIAPISSQLPTTRWKIRMRRLVFKLLLGGGIGTGTGLLYLLAPYSYLFPVVIGMSFALGCFLLCLVLPWQQHKVSLRHLQGSVSRRGKFVQTVGVHLRYGLWIGLVFGLSRVLSNVLFDVLYDTQPMKLSDSLYMGLGFGLSNGLPYGLSFGFLGIALSLLIQPRIGQVQPREVIVWSGSRFFKILMSPSHLCMTLLVGGATAFLFFLSNRLVYVFGYQGGFFSLDVKYESVMGLGMGIGLSLWCSIGIYRSLSSTTFEERHRVVPNQGIRRSGRNGLILGSISGIVATLICALNRMIYIEVGNTVSGPPFGPQMTLSSSLIDCLVVGFCVALLAGLLFGGLAYFQHYVLRWLFFREGSMPWRDPQFLEESVKRILLKRVGGGYSFIHPLFQEYFAAQELGAFSNVQGGYHV